MDSCNDDMAEAVLLDCLWEFDQTASNDFKKRFEISNSALQKWGKSMNSPRIDYDGHATPPVGTARIHIANPQKLSCHTARNWLMTKQGRISCHSILLGFSSCDWEILQNIVIVTCRIGSKSKIEQSTLVKFTKRRDLIVNFAQIHYRVQLLSPLSNQTTAPTL